MRRPFFIALAIVQLAACAHSGTTTSSKPGDTTVATEQTNGAPAADATSGTVLHALALADSEIPADANRLTACDGLMTFENRRSVADVSAGVVLGSNARNIDDDRVHNETVVGAAAAGERCVLFLDSAVESPGWELHVVVSDDKGKTWRLLDAVRKPYYLAAFDSAHFDNATSGCVQVRLDDDAGSGATPGKYESCTSDSGSTWSAFAPKK